MPGTTNLRLYHSPYCGYCRRVTDEAARLRIPLTLLDIYEQPEARDALRRARGRSTVPVLEVPGSDGPELLPESRDIIAYLRANADRYRVVPDGSPEPE